MKTHIYPNVSTAISNNDTTLLQDSINTAISEAKGYCSRFNTELLFSGSNVDPMLLNIVKDLAKWAFIGLANKSIDYEVTLTRYEQAIAKLKDIQAGKLIPDGWPLAVPESKAQSWKVNSTSKKRNNYF